MASSDLSHYHSYEEAKDIDHKTLNALEAWDYLTCRIILKCECGKLRRRANSCGDDCRRTRGANRAQVLDYANSGDTTGDHSRVVGYSAEILVKPQGGTAVECGFSLNEKEKQRLLTIARKSVERVVLDSKL